MNWKEKLVKWWVDKLEETKDIICNIHWFAIVFIIFSLILWILAVKTVCHADEIIQITTDVSIDLDIIQYIESKNDKNAVGSIGEIGLYQISPICLKEWNNFHPKNKYERIDLFNPGINVKIAKWMFEKRIPQMLKAYKIPITRENIIICWNAGIQRVRNNKIPFSTLEYIALYKHYNKYGLNFFSQER